MHTALLCFVMLSLCYQGAVQKTPAHDDVTKWKHLPGHWPFVPHDCLPVYSTIHSGADQRKHQSSASLAFVRGIHRSPVNSPHKGPMTRKIFPLDDVIMVLVDPLDAFAHIRQVCVTDIGTIIRLPQCQWSDSEGYEWTETVTNHCKTNHIHYDEVIMGTMASQITSLPIVYSTVYSGTDERKYQSSASLAFVWGIYRGPVNSPHKWPVTRKMFHLMRHHAIFNLCTNGQ